MLSTRLEGARTHNLKGVDLCIEPGEVVVLTGVSGAGKSSLAMDTLYAEGQRRFVESFSPYARQFLERLERPPMERLEPVPAGVAVDRRAPIKSSRSTVATMADLEPYLAALFMREARPVCRVHGVEGVSRDVAAAARDASDALGASAAVVTYPVRVDSPERYLEVREELAREGYRRLIVHGEAVSLDEVRPSTVLEGSGPMHVVVDRLKRAEHSRLAAAIESAWNRSAGEATVWSGERSLHLRAGIACPECGAELTMPHAGLFSYESPLGACAICRGFGRTLGVDLSKVIPDPTKSLALGAIRPWRGKSTKWERAELAKLCRRHRIALDSPFSELSAAQQRLVLEGDGSWDEGRFPGVLGWFSWLETRTYKMHVRVLLSRYRSYDVCHTCAGKRLNQNALSYKVGGLSLAGFHGLEVHEAHALVKNLTTRTAQGALIQRELESRLRYLDRVGLGYLTLDRQARTLSGGEAQRVTLTAALGTSLHNALFVLDEPTVGLHPSDVAPLLEMIRELAQRHNAVIVVEHDPAVIRAADRVIELGPGAGAEGGSITADGSLDEVVLQRGATQRALELLRPPARELRQPSGFLEVRSARENNLENLDVQIPLGVVCAVTGPSGSGKTTLAVDIVHRALARRFGEVDTEAPGAHDELVGAEQLSRTVLVDQSPLGRTSRGNAATFTKAWDHVRALFAREPEAALLGLTPSHFSFNVAGGRCDACAGEGFETVEMQFLADVRLSCPGCRGRRFGEQVLSVRHRGLDVAEVLELTVDDALARFSTEAPIMRCLGPLAKLGLGYLRLGQPLSTLSGGEAQRLKLARALREDLARTLFVLDEPSAGLHADEVCSVLETMDMIVRAGGSVLVVEHDLAIIQHADWVIDLGPGGGRSGGRLLAAGPPAAIARGSGRTAKSLSAAQKTTSIKRRARKDAPTPSEPAVCVVAAREHNLRDVSVSIPHGRLSVITGPSGSGKSSLAFDVIFAEGQRRFLETLTPYARQFLPTMPRPDVDSVVGVPPSIALEQRTARAGAKSTVATVTEVAHYLRLLFAKLGVPHCPEHDAPITHATSRELLSRLHSRRGRFSLVAPAVRARKGTHLDVFTAAQRSGIEHAFCDGERVLTDRPPKLDRRREHTIDLVIAGLTPAKEIGLELFERALRFGGGSAKLRAGDGEEELFSCTSACQACGFSVPELDPRFFSFNTKQGRCETCDGDGVIERTTRRRKGGDESLLLPCPECSGERLARVPRAVRLSGERYGEVMRRSVESALKWVRGLRFSGDRRAVGEPVVAELVRRLSFLQEVGLDYLALERSAASLSGGELQRLRLAAQLGSGLTGAMYVLDEPTIGLHPTDTGRLLGNLRKLIDIGSTVVVVEHDVDTIRAADYLVDLGPGGGTHGGRIVAAGSAESVLEDPASPTGRALARGSALRESIGTSLDGPTVTLRGVSHHNLRHIDVDFPLERMTVVAGVSGSGKSTLVRQVLLPALRKKLGLVTERPGDHAELVGGRGLVRAVAVDQSPIGRTPRSVPATFLGIWDKVRALFAACPEARVRGFTAARFSFNAAGGGRCPTCEGQGVITHEMSFLPDVVTPCSACEGTRFEPRTLEVRYMGHSIGDVLNLTAEQGSGLFANHPAIARPLQTLCELGAGYVRLGQGSHTLSGGEAQRLKLSSELTASARHEATLYVLDEPTTGLHLDDVAKLMAVLGKLVARGDTLVVIEHHPAVIAGADWVIELGPGGGVHGGRVVASGPPRTVAHRRTPTGAVLKQLLASIGG
jgi:excinuclease ABC subunit A